MSLLRYLGAGLVVGILASLPYSLALRLRPGEEVLVPVIFAAIGAVAGMVIASIAAVSAKGSKQGVVPPRIAYWSSIGLLAGLVFAVPIAFSTHGGSDSNTVLARGMMMFLVSVATIAVFVAYGLLSRKAQAGEQFLPARPSRPLNPAFANALLIAAVAVGSFNRLSAFSDSYSFAMDALIATALVAWIVGTILVVRYTTRRYHKKLAEWEAAHAAKASSEVEDSLAAEGLHTGVDA